ncbi:MAG: hypothetical protein M3O61_08835 [Gemmatimonadota bacterium]|nr:hypothetical protein [Gemmatimonadota bacterium]
MTTPIRTVCWQRSSLLLGFVLLTACSSEKDAAATGGAPAAAPSTSTQSGDEQLADISAYKLTMDKYDKYLAAQRNIALKGKDLSPAEKEAFRARADTRSDNNASLDDMVRNIESEPLMNSAIREAGLSAREFTMITMAMMQTAMAVGVAKMRPNDNQDSLIREMKANPDNVKFWLANEAEITKKQKDLEAEMKRLGALEDASD